jgi:branched-chain amino acid transport system permease protein
MNMQLNISLVSRIGLAAVVALVVVAPLLLSPYSVTLLMGVVPFALAVLGMNLLTGMNGQISIGHSAFFGIGAYTVAVLVERQGWSYLAAGVVGVGAAAVAGLIVGLPALRLRGLYVAITTLGVALTFPGLIEKFRDTTGGNEGLYVMQQLLPPAWLALEPTAWIYYVSFVILAICLVLVRNLRNSKIGRALIAVRDHDRVAESFGVELARTKVVTFVLSAMLAGLGGGIFLVQQQFVGPHSFGLHLAISLFVGMAIGGANTVSGAVIGGVFLQYAPLWTQRVGFDPVLTPAVYGLILIVIMLFMREGIAGMVSKLVRRLGTRPVGEPDDEPGRITQPDLSTATSA